MKGKDFTKLQTANHESVVTLTTVSFTTRFSYVFFLYQNISRIYDFCLFYYSSIQSVSFACCDGCSVAGSELNRPAQHRTPTRGPSVIRHHKTESELED